MMHATSRCAMRPHSRTAHGDSTGLAQDAVILQPASIANSLLTGKFPDFGYSSSRQELLGVEAAECGFVEAELILQGAGQPFHADRLEPAIKRISRRELIVQPGYKLRFAAQDLSGH